MVLLPDPAILRTTITKYQTLFDAEYNAPLNDWGLSLPGGRPEAQVWWFGASRPECRMSVPLADAVETASAVRLAQEHAATFNSTARVIGAPLALQRWRYHDEGGPSGDCPALGMASVQLEAPGVLSCYIEDKDSFYAFPILDANGGARDPATDRYAAVRHGPYQCIVESPDFDPRIGTHSLLILPWPESNDPRLQRPARVQERLCIHEDMAKLDPPIITVRTLPGSTPFREDYLLQAECDFETSDDLVMVVIFANASTEQLSRLFESLGKAAKAQAAPDDPGSSTPEPEPQK
jgi:hypothetical protein